MATEYTESILRVYTSSLNQPVREDRQVAAA